MNRFSISAALVGFFACASAEAASLHLVPAATNSSWAIYLDGSPQNGDFNAVKFDATPVGGTFLNTTGGLDGGVPRPPGQAFTYYNRLLNADPLDFPASLQWTLLGISANANLLGFTGGPLGLSISTAGQPGGRLFLGNVLPSAGGSFIAKVQLSNAAGNIVADLQAVPVPEPTSAAVVGAAMAIWTLSRRRRA
jgi:hypothetical protein